MDVLVAPVYRSLLFPALLFGMPRRLFFLIVIGSLPLVVSFHQVWFLLVTVGALAGARAMGKADPFGFDIYRDLLRIPTMAD